MYILFIVSLVMIDCSVILLTDPQIRFILNVGAVHDFPQPAALWMLTGDILVDGNVVVTSRRTQTRLVMNPTEKKVMEAGAELLSEMLPLLWQNITIEKE